MLISSRLNEAIHFMPHNFYGKVYRTLVYKCLHAYKTAINHFPNWIVAHINTQRQAQQFRLYKFGIALGKQAQTTKQSGTE